MSAGKERQRGPHILHIRGGLRNFLPFQKKKKQTQNCDRNTYINFKTLKLFTRIGKHVVKLYDEVIISIKSLKSYMRGSIDIGKVLV